MHLRKLEGKGIQKGSLRLYSGFLFLVIVGYAVLSMLLQSLWMTGPKSDALLSKAPSLERRSMTNLGGMAKKSTWIETVSVDPRIFIVHNLLTEEECDHLVSLALQKGLSASLITPYGTNKLVESTTRTNKQAWLDFQQDDVVKRVEDKIAKLTKTTPEQGENLQVLHYAKSQQFTEHHDYFDPATDPPENYEKGGNRLITVIVYLQAAEEGGETHFGAANLKLTAAKGDAVMFYNLKHGCDGIDPTCVDKQTLHAGLPPIKGEKWVATKWIHERGYQSETSGGCFDKHPKCTYWAGKTPTECKLNPVWMSKNCRRSCKICQP
ncbi:hypothetical protein GUITHDRAFT_114401 [Guillardia theta CCMP2712]|uniref:Fe2OG dioxygenase domain-containing protein n=1 Tax=Guillardia theta (strain CCMP2712) TaxID=905079 RepID=L1IT50_GUITC|nr:hypothetical protein GUITHDRAFT_114401 [Guillardia theta CCMP2712]EKX39441.1 hypothetical protein GUITHDRAFT_114401 [Guillardia theta CCMP2712]|mmetsp:Transcript_20824/g.69496  ORF Transcript_20824/g.69496 Transcript_20824/m.69496 type:complete len:323 (-) Transcript_20824:119-1087(-)|eukprot:XP_005826421.1 hypothetical protein GUITHDRAFT_114401 [Guillardia theta CCMP2712]